MVYTSKKISAKSGKYFIAQQKQLGVENGFIEEMMEGSKVIKVFTHEEQSIKDFDHVNDALFEASANANTFANVLMPVVMNIGYISYVLVAVVGSIFALNHNHWAWHHPRKDGQDELVPLRGDVRFENVNFSYNPDKQILFDVSLFAKPGQKIAFVGATGAGKTTITNLINRFYDISDGTIRYDGINRVPLRMMVLM